MEVVGEQTKVAEEHVDTFAIGDRRCRRERVLWMNKEDKDVIFKQGLCLYNLSYFRDAKIFFNKVLLLDQEHFESKFYLAEILVNEQLYDDATPILESLLLMDTNDDLIYVL